MKERNKMSLKENNEITVKIKVSLDEFYKIIEEKEFWIDHEFSMNDTYFIPETLNLNKMKGSIKVVSKKMRIMREIDLAISESTLTK